LASRYVSPQALRMAPMYIISIQREQLRCLWRRGVEPYENSPTRQPEIAVDGQCFRDSEGWCMRYCGAFEKRSNLSD
jgi:hypothetical protein